MARRLSLPYPPAVSLAQRIAKLFNRGPVTPEEIAEAEEAKRIQYEQDSIRASQRTMAGQNYQSGRGSRP
jgi:hypothetical protein